MLSAPVSVLPSTRLFPKDIAVRKAEPAVPHAFQAYTVPCGLASYLHIACYVGNL